MHEKYVVITINFIWLFLHQRVPKQLMRVAVARPVSKSDTISIGAPVICCKFQNKYSLPHSQRPWRWPSHLPHPDTSSFAGTPIQNCNLMKNSSILVHNMCQSANPVELSSCTGYCGTYSLWVYTLVCVYILKRVRYILSVADLHLKMYFTSATQCTRCCYSMYSMLPLLLVVNTTRSVLMHLSVLWQVLR